MKNKEYFLDKPEIRAFYLKKPENNMYLRMIGYHNFNFIKPLPVMRTQPFNTIHLIISGKGYLILNNKKYTLYENKMFFLDDHTTFAYYPDPNDPWEYIFFEFNNEIKKEFVGFAGFSNDTPILDCKKPQKILLQLKQTLEKSKGEKTVSYFSAFSAFLAMLDSTQIENKQSEFFYDINFIEEVKAFIQLSYLNSDFNIPYLCHSMNISHTHLSRIFKEKEKISLIEYINNLKINTAKSLLKTSNLCLKEIASTSGFNDYEYFLRFFKKKTGFTPTQYQSHK